jgi:hypothetical protein
MKIYIDYFPNGSTAKIYAFEKQGADQVSYHYDSERKMMVATTIPYAEAVAPTPLLEMPHGMFTDFVKAITDYASENRIKTENENLLQGKLTATEKHLEDMRTHFAKVLDVITRPVAPSTT